MCKLYSLVYVNLVFDNKKNASLTNRKQKNIEALKNHYERVFFTPQTQNLVNQDKISEPEKITENPLYYLT